MKNKNLFSLLSFILIVALALPFWGCERAPRDELTETETGTDTESYSSESVIESEVEKTESIIPTQSECTEVFETESSTNLQETNVENTSETSNDTESESFVTETTTKTETEKNTEHLSESELESNSATDAASGSETESKVDEVTESTGETFSETESLSETESMNETESATETVIETETETDCPHEYKYACSDECTLCGEKRDDPSAHQFGSEDTCVTLTCSDCGFVLEQDHDWKYNSGTATLLSPGSVVMKCTKCGNTDSSDADVLDPALLNMPVVYISDLEGAEIPLTKLQKANGEIVVKYKYVSNNKYGSFECFSEIKVQGASSSGYPKKNYNVKFFRDEALTDKLKVDLGWGTENKYTMKANYVDFSQGRTFFINAADNVANNILWATYDGKVWIPSVYDMDGTFGMYWNGQPIDVATESLTPKNTYPYITADARFVIPGSKMYSILCKYYAEQVKTRYIELRNSVFKSQNFKDTFESFFDLIPEVAYTSDREKWTKVPYPDQNRTNMYLGTKEQLERLDAFFLYIC